MPSAEPISRNTDSCYHPATQTLGNPPILCVESIRSDSDRECVGAQGYMWQALNLLQVKHDTQGLFFPFFLNVKQMRLHPSPPLMSCAQWGLVLVQQSITGHAFISITTDLLFNHHTVFTICLERWLAPFWFLNWTACHNRTVPALSGRWCW